MASDPLRDQMPLFYQISGNLLGGSSPIIYNIQNSIIFKADFVLLACEIKEHLLSAPGILEFAVVNLAETHAVCPDQVREKLFWDFRHRDLVCRYLVPLAEDDAKVDVVVIVNGDA